MASLQLGAGIGIKLSDLEISVIGEAAIGALSFLTKNDSEDAQLKQLATVAGEMRNVQGRPIKLEKSHEWFGHFVCPPPSTIGGRDHGAFVHRANPPTPHASPSKAAVIYGTYDKALPQLGYLLAWYKAENTTEIKVYVEAGELGKLVKQEWCEIERKLDQSQCTSRYVDKATGATAVAEITNKSDNIASLGVCFNKLVGDTKA